MQFGSVKFFKRLIISMVIFIFFAAIGLAVFFGIRFSIEKSKVIAVSSDYNAVITKDNLNLPQNMTLDELYKALLKKGFTSNDIADMLKKNDPSVFDGIYSEHFSSGKDHLPSYSSLFPELYVTPPKEFKTADKTVYLTFDDGPSENTPQILNILKKHNVKATFFMSGGTTPEKQAIMKQVADEGHSIGIHSISHNYDTIYKDPESYLTDLNNTYQNIFAATGVKPDIIRFPGGSINDYNRLIYKDIIAETSRRGFVYYDWDTSGEDAKAGANWTSIYNSVTKNMDGKNRSIVLLHDSSGKEQTVTVVEDLIVALKAEGYSFDKITNEVKPITFAYIS